MATNTNSTVVGVFNDYSTADQAARVVIESGIPRESVHVQSTSRTTTAGRSEYDTHEHEGGIAGFFHRMFSPDDEETTRYSHAIETGRAVVTVDVSESEAERVSALMNQYGAIDIHQDNGSINTGATGTARSMESGSSVPVVDEQIRIGKRAVQRGGVRVYSHVVERPVEEQVTLREEHVRVERRPVDRNISEAEISNLRDQSFEMVETTEEPVIEKRARVTEEVLLGKETTERTQKVRDTVRHTDVKVERFGTTGDTRETSTTGTTVTDQDYERDFRDDWQRNYASQGGDYSMYAPAYMYGYQAANDERYRGRQWDEVESDLRGTYERTYPGSTWDRMKNSIRYGWDKVTGRR